MHIEELAAGTTSFWHRRRVCLVKHRLVPFLLKTNLVPGYMDVAWSPPIPAMPVIRCGRVDNARIGTLTVPAECRGGALERLRDSVGTVYIHSVPLKTMDLDFQDNDTTQMTSRICVVPCVGETIRRLEEPRMIEDMHLYAALGSVEGTQPGTSIPKSSGRRFHIFWHSSRNRSSNAFVHSRHTPGPMRPSLTIPV